MSVELIQDLIKKLADELNTATGQRAPRRRLRAGPRGRGHDRPLGRGFADDGAHDARSAGAGGRRGAAGRAAPAGQVPAWWPTPRSEPSPELAGPAPGAPPQLNPQLARIAEAVAAERMEVLLEPIHALVEGRPRHFEVSMRLLTADGATLDQREYARAARAPA